MTTDQKDLFICIMTHSMATGAAACGDAHPLDCLRLYLRSYPEKEDAAVGAMAAFYRQCSYCPEQSIALEGMTDEQFWQDAVAYWERKDARKAKSLAIA